MRTLQDLVDNLPQRGVVEWLGIRSARRAPVESVEEMVVDASSGIAGDHYSGASGNRHVTLIQAEHLSAVASILGVDAVAPAIVRRNIAVRGINLLALKDKRFRVGDATLEYTGLCHPCSLMEDVLGPGGYNAMRGHGGITARVLDGAIVRIGDPVRM